jgi:2-oxoisovalerate dehydrogenase E1 component alpha subunit
MTRDDVDLLPREEPVQLIDAAGAKVTDTTYRAPTVDRLREGYRGLVIGRRINDQCNALVRQGRLAVYPSSHGQEACQVAAAMVLDDGDWMFPTYRDSVALITRGVPAADAMVLLKGDWHSGYDAKLRGEDTVVIAMCGDGASSEGDFHEALNFAAVFHLPVVFFVQNNAWAISVPLSRQSAAPSLAHKAIGYGMPGEQVDGNDLAALLAVLGEAVGRARTGGGPSLVEAHTYRMQAHTNADDDTRYRDSAEVTAWIDRDPMQRLRTHLVGRKSLTAAAEEQFAAEEEVVATALRDALNTEKTPDPEDLFRHVYATRTSQLEEQWQSLSAELTREASE